MKQRFHKGLDSLDAIFAFINQALRAKVKDESVLFSVHLIVEELFTNMVKYSPEAKQDVLIGVKLQDRNLILTLTDFDVVPFDMTKAGDVAVNETLEKRKVGGLGLHLVRKMVDEIKYEHKNNNSTITIVKRLES